MANSLTRFHPIIQSWFEECVGTPTTVQEQAWPKIALGEHLLITAPTGSGKTLTAFLWAINQFVTGDLETGSTRVLYISPLKALNNDIQRNLLGPLAALRERFELADEPFPAIRVQTRSGDTEPEARRRMARQPPEILITTPESLNLLLSSRSGIGLLRHLDTVILDEIHGVIDNKRGVYLLSAVERIVPLSGEFQRIALSATVRPLATVARFVGGYQLGGEKDAPSFQHRDVEIIEVSGGKRYDIVVRYPEEAASRPEDEKVWESLARDFVRRIEKNRSTLLFTNSRALCERLTFKINETAGRTVAWAHHGSLSREIRFEVEQKLKAGELPAIVATSTLEMGIDIGELDEVILVQSPGEISSAIQRIGRAGHGVGETSHCSIYPTHPIDFIEAAVLSRAIIDRDIEPLRTVEAPLDVLAQVIISMTSIEELDLDELFNEIRRSASFHNLTRQSLDLVINMLAGRYEDNHLRELRPRIALDRENNRIKARSGAVMSLYMSGGVIPDRGYFQMRHNESNARIGELDEEFVWEAAVGKVFSFGTQHWRINKITHSDVMVTPVKPGANAPPFWKAEPLARDFHYAERIGEFLEYADGRLAEIDFVTELREIYRLDEVSARELVAFLERQRQHCRTSLPHRHHLLVEHISRGPGRSPGGQVVLHTGWGARVNRPLAMALEAGWQETWGGLPEIATSNESIVIQIQGDVGIEQLLSLAPADALETRLRARLEGSGYFGARFRENAGRALLLSKGRFNERKPLWMSRLQSQKLMSSVSKFEDFPLLLETWRTCLKDEFDLASLRRVLEEIGNGEIRVSEVRTESPSPFAQSVAWGQVNTYMYMDDSPKSAQVSNLRPDLLEEVVFNPGLRPPVPTAIIERFESRRQRRDPGYAPESAEEIVEWVKERTVIPACEWQWEELPEQLKSMNAGEAPLIVAREDYSRVLSALTSDADEDATATCLANWLQYYGPMTLPVIEEKLGIQALVLARTLSILEDDRTVIRGRLVASLEEECWCDAENYESLLRFMRREQAPSFETLPVRQLPLFLHHWQARNAADDPASRLSAAIDRLRCLPAAAELWESEILPARIDKYAPADLDHYLQQSDLIWCGTGPRQIAFCYHQDLDLLPAHDSTPAGLAEIIPDPAAKYDFATILQRSESTTAQLADALWQSTWAGFVVNDSMTALRTGIDVDFKVPETGVAASGRRRASRRGGFQQWRNAVPFSGNWHRLNRPDAPSDLLETEELNKDRVRVLIDRYGILFRELLLREAPAFGWRALFRSMRLMELAGELIGGYFFDGIPGPQFVSPETLRVLQRPLPSDSVYWLNAADPISLCGIGIDAMKADLPRRVPSNHLVYHGDRLVMVSERNAKTLTINVCPDDSNLPKYFSLLRHLLYRKSRPLRKLVLETINGMPANKSEYMAALGTAFDVNSDYKALYIERTV